MMHILYDVIIIGAGLAGLAVGDCLKSHGYNVMILEAGSRVGGRVVTSHLADNTHFELGAFSFGDGEKLLWNYIQRFNLPAIKQTSMEKYFCFKNYTGSIFDKGVFLKGKEQEIFLYELVDYFRPKLEKIAEDTSLAQALESVNASKEAIEWLQNNSFLGLLGNFEILSTKAALDFLKQYDDSTSFYALKGGNDQLPQALARELEDHILCNHHVKKVESFPHGCKVKGSTFTFEAKKVIFAIPLPELHKIEITPPLSLQKQNVIQNAYYTPCARISIVAPPFILNKAPRVGVFLFSDELGWFREQSEFQVDPQKKTVMNVSVAGNKSEKLFLSVEYWKKNIDNVLLTHSLEWNSEQAEYYVDFCKEGYVCFSIDTYKDQDCLQKAEGNFYFAGEHTSRKFASMNGAIESGLRAAHQIIQDK